MVARGEKGMVLVLVLVVVALLTSLLTEFAFSTLVDLRLAETFRDSTRAYYLAKGGIRAGRIILQEDSNAFDAPTELWGQGISNYPVGDGVVSIAAEDLDGRLNLNRLVTPQGNIDVVVKERLLRLLEIVGAEDPAPLTDALIDWLDPDDDPQPLGAEESVYRRLEQPLPCKNGPLDSLSELSLVHGFTPETLERLLRHVTVHGGAKLNVNTATTEVLLCWDADMTGEMVDTIISAREQEPWLKTEDLKEKIGVEALSILNRNLDIGFTSDTYRLEAWGGVNDGARTVEAIVRKSGDKLLYLKVK